jgi:hypothetical protein
MYRDLSTFETLSTFEIVQKILYILWSTFEIDRNIYLGQLYH